MNRHTRWSANLISLLGGFVIFANAMATGTISTDKQITQIRAFTTYAQIIYDPPFANSEGCPHGAADRRVAIDWNSNEKRKVMYATALLAYATNKTVGFSINGCHPSGLPKVVVINVKN